MHTQTLGEECWLAAPPRGQPGTASLPDTNLSLQIAPSPPPVPTSSFCVFSPLISGPVPCRFPHLRTPACLQAHLPSMPSFPPTPHSHQTLPALPRLPLASPAVPHKRSRALVSRGDPRVSHHEDVCGDGPIRKQQCLPDKDADLPGRDQSNHQEVLHRPAASGCALHPGCWQGTQSLSLFPGACTSWPCCS